MVEDFGLDISSLVGFPIYNAIWGPVKNKNDYE